MSDVRLGVVGTGFIASNLIKTVGRRDGFQVGHILTRRAFHQVEGMPGDSLTHSIERLVSDSDVVVECSGDPIWATDVVAVAVQAQRPVVTMNTEFHITTGTAFVHQGLVTEAAGDQPGCLAVLHEEAVGMGFEPVVYGNMKGFLNPNPTPEEMSYWGKRQGISLPMVTSFTDGTKVQAEQVLVANHFAATISSEGMLGPSVQSLDEGVDVLTKEYEKAKRPISDFIVNKDLPHGVFLVATHDPDQADALDYYKLGAGPYYTIVRPNIFVHLEILNTVTRVMEAGKVLLDNSPNPELSLAAVAKRDLKAGFHLPRGIGSFELRGQAIRISDHPDHVPIGLIQDATVVNDVSVGELLTKDDLELDDSHAQVLWRRGETFGRREAA